MDVESAGGAAVGLCRFSRSLAPGRLGRSRGHRHSGQLESGAGPAGAARVHGPQPPANACGPAPDGLVARVCGRRHRPGRGPVLAVHPAARTPAIRGVGRRRVPGVLPGPGARLRPVHPGPGRHLPRLAGLGRHGDAGAGPRGDLVDPSARPGHHLCDAGKGQDVRAPDVCHGNWRTDGHGGPPVYPSSGLAAGAGARLAHRGIIAGLRRRYAVAASEGRGQLSHRLLVRRRRLLRVQRDDCDGRDAGSPAGRGGTAPDARREQQLSADSGGALGRHHAVRRECSPRRRPRMGHDGLRPRRRPASRGARAGGAA